MQVKRTITASFKTVAIATTLLATSAISLDAAAQAPAKNIAEVRSYIEKHRNEIVDQFVELVAIQGVRENAPMLQDAASRIAEKVRQRGLHVEQWQTSVGIPVVFAEKRVPGAVIPPQKERDQK